MSSGLTLSIAVMMATAAVISLFGFSAIRAGVRPLGFWFLGWASHLVAGALVLWGIDAPAIRPVTYLFSSFVAPLMLMGAYAHVGREVPAWLPTLGVLAGAIRIVAYQMGSPETANLLAALFEPPVALYAAYLVLKVHPRATRPGGDTMLALALGLFALAELIDSSLRYNQFPNWTVWAEWCVLGLPLVTTQFSLYISRLGRSAASSERRAHTVEQRLRIVTESADTVIAEYDERGILTYMSDNVELRTGQRVESLIGRNALEFLETREDSPVFRALQSKGRITETDILTAPNTPTRAVLSDGRIAHYEVHRAAYRTDEGQLRILLLAHDITGRIENDEALLDSARLLNRAEEIGSFGSWEYFPSTGEMIWSAHLSRMHGLEPSTEHVDPTSVGRVVLAEDIPRLIAFGKELDNAPSTPRIDYRIRRPQDGQIRHFRTIGEVELDADGQIDRITGTSRDVTEQEQLEAALRRGREHLDALVDSNIVGVFFSDANGLIVRANDAVLSALGYEQSDLPLTWREVSPKGALPRDAQAFAEMEQGGTALPFEKKFVSKSGASVPLLIGFARLDPNQAMVIAVDLRERKRAEALIAQHQKQLEDTVAERTRELVDSRDQLLQAERLASVGTLAAGVAHQINNPIGAILNGSEYAMLCVEDEDAFDIFKMALESNLTEARRCALIVKSMLQFSRDEITEKWVHDLNQVTRHAHRAISAYAQDRGAVIKVIAPNEPIMAVISPIEIEQALVNILRNAIESSDGGAEITLSLRSRDKTAEIEVLDDGRGIEPSDQDRLFEPFYSTRTRDGGTGLGLSVAHGVVTDHGGEIQIESFPTEGTRILVRLPIVA